MVGSFKAQDTSIFDPKQYTGNHFYRSGVNTSEPGSSPSSGDGGICPPGHYCPVKTGEPVPCPKGTYSNKVKSHWKIRPWLNFNASRENAYVELTASDFLCCHQRLQGHLQKKQAFPWTTGNSQQYCIWCLRPCVISLSPKIGVSVAPPTCYSSIEWMLGHLVGLLWEVSEWDFIFSGWQWPQAIYYCNLRFHQYGHIKLFHISLEFSFDLEF